MRELKSDQKVFHSVNRPLNLGKFNFKFECLIEAVVKVVPEIAEVEVEMGGGDDATKVSSCS